MKKRETNEQRQTRLVNLCRHLHISVMAPSYKLDRRRANDRIRRAKQREGPREGVSPVSISITLFISSYRYYAITNTDYTQYYINTCSGAVRLASHDACSICLVIRLKT